MESKRCLVLLPIGVTLRRDSPTFLAIYEHVLRPALYATGFPLDILRGDEMMRSGMTLQKGLLWLQQPHIVIAELTTGHSGVLHDLIHRSFLADRTILVSQQAEDILPRFASYRQIIYTLSEDGITRLYRELQHHVHEVLCPTLISTHIPGNVPMRAQ